MQMLSDGEVAIIYYILCGCKKEYIHVRFKKAATSTLNLLFYI